MSSYQTPTYPQMDSIQPQTPSSTIGYPQPGFQSQQPTYPQTPGYQQPPYLQPGFQQPTGFTGYVPSLHTGFIPEQESYIENILRLNKDKIATVYMNFENSQWGSKIFKGAIEAAGKDHIILRDPVTNMRYLLLMIYLNYITFDEEIIYEYPFAAPNIPTPYPQTQLRKKDTKEQDQSKKK